MCKENIKFYVFQYNPKVYESYLIAQTALDFGAYKKTSYLLISLPFDNAKNRCLLYRCMHLITFDLILLRQCLTFLLCLAHVLNQLRGSDSIYNQSPK